MVKVTLSGLTVYNITPVGKPRMTQRDKWMKRQATEQYWIFKDQCRAYDIQFQSGCRVVFVLPMPASWSKKKKAEMDGKPHQQKPDLDNLIKALGDALHDDDSGLWDYRASKIWGYEGQIRIVG